VLPEMVIAYYLLLIHYIQR